MSLHKKKPTQEQEDRDETGSNMSIDLNKSCESLGIDILEETIINTQMEMEQDTTDNEEKMEDSIPPTQVDNNERSLRSKERKEGQYLAMHRGKEMKKKNKKSTENQNTTQQENKESMENLKQENEQLRTLIEDKEIEMINTIKDMEREITKRKEEIEQTRREMEKEKKEYEEKITKVQNQVKRTTKEQVQNKTTIEELEKRLKRAHEEIDEWKEECRKTKEENSRLHKELEARAEARTNETAQTNEKWNIYIIGDSNTERLLPHLQKLMERVGHVKREKAYTSEELLEWATNQEIENDQKTITMISTGTNDIRKGAKAQGVVKNIKDTTKLLEINSLPYIVTQISPIYTGGPKTERERLTTNGMLEE